MNVMSIVQDRLHYFNLVTIWLDLPSLNAGEYLGKIQGNPRCGCPLGIFVTPRPQSFAP